MNANIAPDLISLAHPIDALHELPGNPRRGDVDAVARSYATFGQRKPVVVRRDDDGRAVVIAGNHQLAAARKLGWTHLAVAWADDLDQDAARAFALADNRTAELGGYDNDALIALIRSVEDEALLAATGWTEEAIADLLPDDAPTQLNDPDTTPPLAVPNPVTAPGSVWRLGKNRLVCGDSTDPDTVTRALNGSRAALLFTSPPYGLARDYKGGDLDPANLAKFLTAAAPHCDILAVNLGILRENGAIVRYWDTYIDTAESAGLKLISWNIWDREQPYSMAQQTATFPIEHELVFVFAGGDPVIVNDNELGQVLVFARGPVELNATVPNKNGGKSRAAGTNRQSDGSSLAGRAATIKSHRPLGTVFRSPPAVSETVKFKHPAMFPVALPAAYIAAATDVHDTILDPFGGAGTTLIAAHDADRRAALIELSPEYCDVICRRFQEHTGIVPVLEATGEPHDFTVEVTEDDA